MQLKFDWLIALEELRRGIMVTDMTLDGPRAPESLLCVERVEIHTEEGGLSRWTRAGR